MLQRLWEIKLAWDESVPADFEHTWWKWRKELSALRDLQIPRLYSPEGIKLIGPQLHGFCDASEVAYSGIVYLRGVDSRGSVYIALVIAKTKLVPIKRLSIPRLELCGGVILAKLLSHVSKVLDIPCTNIFAWTDSRVILGWLEGNPRRFLPFVGNRVAEIMEAIPVGCWRHVNGTENLVDCASRGLFPSELTKHDLWWQGPQWLKNKVVASLQWMNMLRIRLGYSLGMLGVCARHARVMLEVCL